MSAVTMGLRTPQLIPFFLISSVYPNMIYPNMRKHLLVVLFFPRKHGYLSALAMNPTGPD